MSRLSVLIVVCAMLVVFATVNVNAFSAYARSTGKVCGYCHVDPAGGGTLTTEGQYYFDNGTLPPTTSTPPTTLTATATSSVQINLGWQDKSTDETGFKVERASSASGVFTVIATLGAGVTTYSNTGLTASTIYYYRVCAYNSGGNSTYSNTASATTSAAAVSLPIAPSTLSATAVSSVQINLGWQDKSADETGFKVERASSASGVFTVIATLGVGVTTYSNTGLTASTIYYYRVCAYNSAGNSAYSNAASAATLAVANSLPVAPETLTAKVASFTQINLSWQDKSVDETGFKVERASSKSGSFAVIATLSAGVNTYSNTGLTESKKYYYRVCAYNSQGNSGYTNTASATTLSAPPLFPVVITPTFDPDGGTYATATSVTIACSTDGSTIHYTTNGADPTENDLIISTGSNVTVDHSMTLKACAWKDGADSSSIKSSAYTITTTLKIELQTGWNMVSIPLVPTAGAWADWTSAFGGVTPLYAGGWNADSSAYFTSLSPVRGRGYWVRMSAPATGTIVGTSSGTTYTIDIKGDSNGRWNLIGNPFSSSISWNDDQIQVSGSGDQHETLLQAHADGWINDYGWYWDGIAYKLVCDTQSYDVSGSLDSLQATQGCWLRAFRDCQLILHVD